MASSKLKCIAAHIQFTTTRLQLLCGGANHFIQPSLGLSELKVAECA
jgi:hypothetical protein